MDLIEISKDINEKACDYNIGQLQIFRARIKNLRKVKKNTSRIIKWTLTSPFF